MTERAYLSIGEVLDLLKEEFPDVTISKIRFLESQGLLDPERTPSGYRKFYDQDVERLRWILQQQKEHFLPLKVIKDRLEAEADAAAAPPGPPETTEPARGTNGGEPETPRPTGDPLSPGLTAVSLTRDELVEASGLDGPSLDQLERFGLVGGRPVGGQLYYDEEALIVARLAAAVMRYGVEARHLRMYRTAAEREAGFFEQLILPLVKQRNPAARREAVERLADLARLGQGLRAAMLRQALRGYLHNP